MMVSDLPQPFMDMNEKGPSFLTGPFRFGWGLDTTFAFAKDYSTAVTSQIIGH
jgi:hypothetical protein